MPSGMEEMPTDEQLEKLSAIADVPVEVLKNKLSKKDKGFIYLKRQLSYEKAEEIKALGIKGIAFQKELKRHYPMGKSVCTRYRFYQYRRQRSGGLGAFP